MDDTFSFTMKHVNVHILSPLGNPLGHGAGAATTVEPLPRLLLLDDDAIFCLALVRELQQRGYEIEAAHGGRQAMAMLQAKPYNVLLLDLVIPDMGGVEVMARVQECCPDIPIIVITGHADIESAIFGVKFHIMEYLIKGIPIPILANRIVRALMDNAERIDEYGKKRRLPDALAPACSHLTIAADEDAGAFRIAEPHPPELHVPPIHLDVLRQLALIEGPPRCICRLTTTETVLLGTLMMAPNRVVSMEQLARSLSGHDVTFDVSRGAIFHIVHRLRRKIERDLKEPRLIQSVRKRGYVYVTQ